MAVRPRARVLIPAVAVAAVAAAAGIALAVPSSKSNAQPAPTTSQHSDAGSGMAGMPMPGNPAPAAAKTSTSAGATKAAPPVFLAATLTGRNEVAKPGGEAVGDPAGQAHIVLRVQGDQVAFALSWSGLSAPTAGHIHIGPSGQNGGVQIPLFVGAVPAGINAVTGTVTVPDLTKLARIETQPDAFYANLHTARFPGGAVRGQLAADAHPEDLTSVVRSGPLASLDSGDQEIPAADGKATGDPTGHAAAFVHPGPASLHYAISWSGLTAPTAAHLHRAGVGSDGPVVLPLFAAAAGLPTNITGVAGRVTGVPAALLSQVNTDPSRFYTNLHTARFPGGAVRGQLFRIRGN